MVRHNLEIQMTEASRIQLIRVRVKLRQDYNENHDPKSGEFTFSVGTPGSASMFNGSDHKTLKAAETRAAAQSAAKTNLTHVVYQGSKAVSAFRNGSRIPQKVDMAKGANQPHSTIERLRAAGVNTLAVPKSGSMEAQASNPYEGGRSTAKDVMDTQTNTHPQGWETVITHRDGSKVSGIGASLETSTSKANAAHTAALKAHSTSEIKARVTLAGLTKTQKQDVYNAKSQSKSRNEMIARQNAARLEHNQAWAKNPEVQAQAKAVIEKHAAEDRTLENSAGFNRDWYNKSQELGKAGGTLSHYSMTTEKGAPLSVEGVSREHAEARARANGMVLKGDTGHQSFEPREFINTVQHSAYSTFTAQNPMAVEGSAPASKEENAKNMREMLKDLKTQGARFTIVQGKYGNPETTVMAHHTSNFGEKEADALAKKYGQTSVMHADKGKAHMTYVNGPHAGEVHHSAPVEGGHGEHLTFDSEAKNYYTRYHGVKFSFNFPTLP